MNFHIAISLSALSLCGVVRGSDVLSAAGSTSEQRIEVPAHVYYRFEYQHAFPKPFGDACPAVLEAIKIEGLNPGTYFVEVEFGREKPSLLLYHLWDVRAFPLKNPPTFGNPGGQCRTVEYDRDLKKVTRIYGWR